MSPFGAELRGSAASGNERSGDGNRPDTVPSEWSDRDVEGRDADCHGCKVSKADFECRWTGDQGWPAMEHHTGSIRTEINNFSPRQNMAGLFYR